MNVLNVLVLLYSLISVMNGERCLLFREPANPAGGADDALTLSQYGNERERADPAGGADAADIYDIIL